MELLSVPAGFSDLRHRFVPCYGNIALSHNRVRAISPFMRFFYLDGDVVRAQSFEVAESRRRAVVVKIAAFARAKGAAGKQHRGG